MPAPISPGDVLELGARAYTRQYREKKKRKREAHLPYQTGGKIGKAGREERTEGRARRTRRENRGRTGRTQRTGAGGRRERNLTSRGAGRDQRASLTPKAGRPVSVVWLNGAPRAAGRRAEGHLTHRPRGGGAKRNVRGRASATSLHNHWDPCGDPLTTGLHHLKTPHPTFIFHFDQYAERRGEDEGALGGQGGDAD